MRKKSQPDSGDQRLSVYAVSAGGMIEVERVVLTERAWRERLTPEQYRVTRTSGTECAFSGNIPDAEGNGVYRCVCCENDLFLSGKKYDSGSGWPSFFQPVHDANVRLLEDRSHGMRRIEVRCVRCDAHLGHVFPDGHPPTGMRFCVNAAALKFQSIPE